MRPYIIFTYLFCHWCIKVYENSSYGKQSFSVLLSVTNFAVYCKKYRHSDRKVKTKIKFSILFYTYLFLDTFWVSNHSLHQKKTYCLSLQCSDYSIDATSLYKSRSTHRMTWQIRIIMLLEQIILCVWVW